MNNGWTPTPAFIARKENLTALQNYLLENGMKESAAAVENVIELIPLEAKRLDWQDEANAEAAEWKDNLRSMEESLH